MPRRIPTITESLHALISQPSVSSVSPEFDQSNMEVIHTLSNWFADIGFHAEILPLSGAGGKANMIASSGKGPGGLVLAGHTDTVPYDDNRWKMDPFRLTEKDNRFYGLGIADMKGFFSLVLEAVSRFDVKQFKHPLIILATADEESSMDGAKELAMLGRPRARFAVIGEPTGLKPVSAHKGIIMEAIHILGKTGHSSDPGLGDNAIEGLYHVLAEMLQWRDALQLRHQNSRFKVPQPTLNLGKIAGGDNPNRICGASELHFDLRFLPGMEMESLRDELDARLQALAEKTGFSMERTSLIDGTPAFATADDSPLIQSMEKLTGYAAESVAFCTEGPYLSQMGMETVIWGPGNIEQAHQPDEFLSFDCIRPSVDLLEQLIIEYCIQAN